MSGVPEETVRAVLAAAAKIRGRNGGRSKSPKKIASIRTNLIFGRKRKLRDGLLGDDGRAAKPVQTSEETKTA